VALLCVIGIIILCDSPMKDHTFNGVPVSSMLTSDIEECLRNGIRILSNEGVVDPVKSVMDRLEIELQKLHNAFGRLVELYEDFESRFSKLDSNPISKLQDEVKILKARITELQKPKHKNTNTIDRTEELNIEEDSVNALDFL